LKRDPGTVENATYVGKNAEKLSNSANYEFYRVLTEGIAQLLIHKTSNMLLLR